LRAITLNLASDERIIFEGHPSWRAILGFYAKGVLVIGVLAALVVLSGNTIGDGVSESTLALVLIIGSAVIVAVGFLKRVSTRYVITDRRLYVKHGIISRNVQQTRIERVQDVNYTQSLFERLLQIGDVDFDTAAGDDYNFIFSGVAEPQEVVEKVDEATRSLQGSRAAGGLGDEQHGHQPGV
jgi:uncharacterized membrane protein YdbT with pleckstrin-like domain